MHKLSLLGKKVFPVQQDYQKQTGFRVVQNENKNWQKYVGKAKSFGSAVRLPKAKSWPKWKTNNSSAAQHTYHHLINITYGQSKHHHCKAMHWKYWLNSLRHKIHVSERERKFWQIEKLRVLLTSSGSVSLNSQPSPVQEMNCWQDLSVRSSSRNCQSWMGPEPWNLLHESKKRAPGIGPEP